MNSNPKVVIIGGGAAGFMAAITCAEANPRAEVTILEKAARPLGKVRISGGGRCNVTHACFDPAQLVTFYPRGGKALRGPFMRFSPVTRSPGLPRAAWSSKLRLMAASFQ